MNNSNNQQSQLRIIKTARDVRSINSAAQNGFFPLIKELKEAEFLRQRYGVLQNKLTNEIVVSSARTGYRQYDDKFDYSEKEWNLVIPFTDYYPHHYRFECPFAAYLIPNDIKVEEKVLIEDLIEDYSAGYFWDTCMRLDSCEAIWTGSDLEILYDPKIHGVCNMIG